ncbi:MAG: DUF6465 family protein [Lachnospiraceae bacterium]|nr:DUF6465 family protein [Lachnospiraceae bacterium]
MTKQAAKASDKAAKKEKKAAKKTRSTICVEMGSLSVDISGVKDAVKKAVKEQGLEAGELKIYINTAEQAAYYTVDGQSDESFRIDLKTL